VEAAEKDEAPEVQHQAIKELYAKFGMSYIGEEPHRVEDWPWRVAFVVEYLKQFQEVQEACAKAGRPLVRHPEYRWQHED